MTGSHRRHSRGRRAHRNPRQSKRDKLLEFNGIQRRVPAAKSTIYEWIKLDVFPSDSRIGRRKRYWTESEVDRFVAGD